MSDLLARLQAAVGETYHLEKELGGGGMSRVFLAEEVRLGRHVVIKVLPPEMVAGVNKERFEREIKLAASLQHPHVVPLLTAGTAASDLIYYVMPYIEGESLRAKLAREGELPVDEVVRILREVTDALAYAHQHGVVHRDIKPDNVLLSGEHAVVTDFGVAKAVTASSGDSSSLTSLGVALGTPAYMSPEQAAADPHVDHRADIYAVGALAYEMLCGQPPFTGVTPQQVLAAHVSQTPEPITQHRHTIPSALAELVMRCLEKRAADRWQSADEVKGHLAAMVTPSGGVTPTGTQPVAAIGAEAAVAQAHPVRVAGLFGLAAVGALAIVYALMQLLGLPDWVLLGAMGLLVIGLPIMLVTGHHERRRAIARTTGMIRATPATGVDRHFTWRKATLGGGVAFAGLALVAAAYMAMRSLGIGPVGTLMASGVLEARDPLIVADFQNNTPDSTLALAVTEALRIDLGQSPVVKLVERADLAPVLERMGRPPGGTLDVDLAREVAAREGYKAVLTGEISTLGTGYVMSARLVSAQSGETLVPVREGAESAAALLGAVDRLSASLRERIGESFKSIRASEPLERVTTSSLDALRLFTRATRAEAAGEWERSIDLLEEAIALDSNFASAYRRLGVTLANNRRERSRINAAATRAYELRDRLPAIERYRVIANYYEDVEPDPERAIRAYQSVLEIDPENWSALNNTAVALEGEKRFKEAEEYFRRAQNFAPRWQSFGGLVRTVTRQGRWAEAESTLVEYEQWGPNHPRAVEQRLYFEAARRNFDRVDSLIPVLDGAGRHGSAVFARAAVREIRGNLAAVERVAADRVVEAEREGDQLDVMTWALKPVLLEWRYRGGPDAALDRLSTVLERHPLEKVDAADRPYGIIAELFAAAGRGDEVRRLRGEWESAANRPAAPRYRWDGLEAVADGRYADAVAAYRAAYGHSGSVTNDLFPLARAYELNGQLDSALVVYERAVSAPEPFRMIWEFDELAPTYKRLGELYEDRGERDKAVQFYDDFVELWTDADPELWPVVDEVRGRIARLVGEGAR